MELQKLMTTRGRTIMLPFIKQKEVELDELLESEELWWSQRAKTLWLTHGDKNTIFPPQSQPKKD